VPTARRLYCDTHGNWTSITVRPLYRGGKYRLRRYWLRTVRLPGVQTQSEKKGDRIAWATKQRSVPFPRKRLAVLAHIPLSLVGGAGRGTGFHSKLWEMAPAAGPACAIGLRSVNRAYVGLLSRKVPSG